MGERLQNRVLLSGQTLLTDREDIDHLRLSSLFYLDGFIFSAVAVVAVVPAVPFKPMFVPISSSVSSPIPVPIVVVVVHVIV